jgi:hypothetical protein
MAIASTHYKRVLKVFHVERSNVYQRRTVENIGKRTKDRSFKKNTCAQFSRTEANRYDFSAVPDMKSTFDMGFHLGHQSGGLSGNSRMRSGTGRGKRRINWILGEKISGRSSPGESRSVAARLNGDLRERVPSIHDLPRGSRFGNRMFLRPRAAREAGCGLSTQSAPT